MAIADLKTMIPGPKSMELSARLKRYETPNVTHLANDFPVFWEKAYGSNVEDVDGNRFVDLTSAFGVASLGHANDAVRAAVLDQLRKLPHGMGDVHPPAIKVEVLEKLAKLFPEVGAQSILCSSGAEAVEAALKTARLYTGKPGVITFAGSYHGLSYGTLAVGGQPRFREPFADQIANFGTVAAYGDIESALDLLVIDAETQGRPIGAILFEPIQGRAGVNVPTPGWMTALRAFADAHGILLIADEIMTCFGRTGKWLAVNHENMKPDLICLGKALTGMLPFSACVGKRDVMKAWPSLNGEALHTSTFLGNPLGCAAALATIKELETHDWIDRAADVGEKVLEELSTWHETAHAVKEVRGRGLMIGIELSYGDKEGLAFDITKKVLKKGVILLPSGESGNVISLTPPLNINTTDLSWALSKIREAILQIK